MGYLIRVTDISLVRSVNGYFINFLFQCEEKLQKKKKTSKDSSIHVVGSENVRAYM